MALECDSNANLLDTLGNALEDLIKHDKAGKLNSIDTLHMVSVKLAAKVRDKKPNKVLLLKNVIKGKTEERSEVVDKLITVLNDYEISVSVPFQQMCQQNPEFVEKVLENATVMLESVTDTKDEKEAMEVLYKAVMKTLAETSESKIKQALRGQRAVHGYESDDLQLLVKSCKVASNLDVDAVHSIKLNQILSTLQQVHQSSVALTNEEVGNENLINALEDIIKEDTGDKLKVIDDLHTLSVELAEKVHDKKPNNALLLKNMIKGPHKVQKSEMVNKLFAALSDRDSSVSEAFQQMSQQNPEFVGQVLQNAATMLANVSDTTDEKEAMEILHRAILKTVSETSNSKIRQALRGQQALHGDESNDLQLLVKSCKVAGNLDVDALHSVKLSHILSSLQQVCQSSVSLTSEEVGDENLMTLLKIALECDTNADLLENVGNALEAAIKQGSGDKIKTIDDLQKLSSELTVKVRDKRPNKALLLRNMIKDHHKADKSQVVKKLIAMLSDHETTVCVAFQHMCEQDPDFIDKVLENAVIMLKTVVNKQDEKEAMETLHRAIIKTVAETSESKVQEALYNKKSDDFHLLVKDAISLAKALGMCEVVTILNEVLKDRNSVQVLAKDTIVMEVLKRLTVMRQLAESRPNLINALKDLHSDPYAARSDPRLRELVRESAMLMVIPEESLIKSSADIPSSIMFSDNCLAVEDFMVKTRQCGKTFLILKKGIQAVIPREAARDVLTGRVPYTMLDENGIHYFKPLHVFNALKLPRVATNRFHNYTYVHPALLDDDSSSGTRGSSISMEDLRKTVPNGHGHHSPNHQEVNLR
ncbi:Protein kinase, unclassified specificity, partial [Sarracenia purpurea var. burkii]